MKLKTTFMVALSCLALDASALAANTAASAPPSSKAAAPAAAATPATVSAAAVTPAATSTSGAASPSAASSMPVVASAPAVASASAATPVASPANPSSSMFKNENDRASYTVGVDMGQSLKAQNLQMNVDLLARGIKDGLSGGPLLLNDEERRQTLLNLQRQLVAKQQVEMKVLAQKNLQAGEKFLNDNKAKPGVKTTTSGLQYKIIEAGAGKMPNKEDVVTVDYEGKLINGQVFDSTYKTGKPVTFQLSQVIDGWQQALSMMKAGATWELYIPAKLAYGEKGTPGGSIGPNETLLFKVHLIAVGNENKKQS